MISGVNPKSPCESPGNVPTPIVLSACAAPISVAWESLSNDERRGVLTQLFGKANPQTVGAPPKSICISNARHGYCVGPLSATLPLPSVVTLLRHDQAVQIHGPDREIASLDLGQFDHFVVEEVSDTKLEVRFVRGGFRDSRTQHTAAPGGALLAFERPVLVTIMIEMEVQTPPSAQSS